MESPRREEEDQFWAWRRENGWHPLPESLLERADAILKEDREHHFVATLMGVPIEELSEREAKAALVLLSRNFFGGHLP